MPTKRHRALAGSRSQAADTAGGEFHPALRTLPALAGRHLDSRSRENPGVTPDIDPGAAQAVLAACSPNSWTMRSRITNFWALPVMVMGISGTKRM
jgi:hypothetical protein